MVTNSRDWITVVNRDLKDLQLCLTYDQISNISKQSFKKMIKDSCQELYFNNIHQNKQKLSKGSEICYAKLELQNYLKSSQKLTTETMKKIIKVRLCDIQVKCNFPGAFKDTKCLADPLCDGQDSNKHIFLCKYMST